VATLPLSVSLTRREPTLKSMGVHSLSTSGALSHCPDRSCLYDATPRVLIELRQHLFASTCARSTGTLAAVHLSLERLESRLPDTEERSFACSLVTRSRRAWRVTDMGLFQFCATDTMEPARNSSRKLRALRRRPVGCSRESELRLSPSALQLLPLTVDGLSP
jgi:hypothetical protein